MAQDMTDEQRSAVDRAQSLIQKLLELPAVKKHDTRFEGEVALVAPSSRQAEVDQVVSEIIGTEAVKPAGSPLSPELQAHPVLEMMGGVRGGQTLFLDSASEGVSVYVAYWPWGSGANFTVKIGVYAPG